MALDPNIILQGQPVNVMGAISAGNQAAAETNAIRQQNALAQLYQEHGPGIMQGQQPALNALARMDPAAALGVQDARLGMDQTRQDMQFTRQKMDFLTAEERRAAEEYARGLSAAEAEAEAAKIEGAVKMGMGLKTPQEWDAFMSQNSPDLVGQFGNRQAIANKYMSMADILKGPQSGGDRFKVVGSQLVDLQAEGGPRAVLTSPGQEEVIYGADGRPIVTRGPAGTAAKFTESQSKDITYATRARGALEALEGGTAEALTDRGAIIADKIPLGFGREFQSPEYQVARNAGDEFLQAILRKDTGAAITSQEQDLYGTTYLPQPGDGPELLEQKRAARERALLALEGGMSPEAILAQERALQAQSSRGPSDLPRAGMVEEGYRFKGGNPADPNNWEQVR